MPEFRLPGDLTKLSRAELAQLKADAAAEVKTIIERDTTEAPFTLAEGARVNELTAAIKAVTARDSELETAEAADNAAIEESFAAARAALEEDTTADTTPETLAGETPQAPDTAEALTG